MGYKSTWFKPGGQTQFAITCNCLQAFLLFGYDQGVLGGLQTNTNFLSVVNNPNAAALGIIVSSYNLGCLLGCGANFWCSGKFGRRQAIWFAMFFISLGAILQCSAFGVPQFVIGRIITGFGVGIDTSTVPMYQAELCKPEVRGRLVTTEVLFTGLGVTIAYFFDYGMSFTKGPIAWRLPIACQVIPAMLVSVILFGLPETPRYLMQKGRHEEAIGVMCQVYGLPPDDERIQSEQAAIVHAIALETENPFQWSKILQPDRVRTRRRLFLACLALFMNQWAGINVIVFYIATVLETNVGLSKDLSLIVGGFVNLAFVVGSLVPALGLDRIGRKKPMMFGAAGAGISMMIIAILLSFNGTEKEKVTSVASIAFFVTFMLCFGASMNAIPWCYSAEILPLNARAKGTAFAVMTNWIWVFTIVMVTPTMIASITWKTYLIFMATNLAFVPAVYYLFPETKGLTLEDIDLLFIKDDLVSDSSESSSETNGPKMSEDKGPTSQHVE
ncbi:general substrate transporter [Xylariales sp. PMI_506]|nr:general substrate transporter [Xylariales sp. PMI_506]